MIKTCLVIAGGIVGICIGVKLLFTWDRIDDEKPQKITCDESSDEETILVKNESSSRSGHTIKTTYKRKLMKLSHMKKQDLIDECTRRNIASVGTVRVLRERLRIAREEEKA
jgi:hypothetical protein|tara:strand:+ start:1857 stop:2192 length:336 start_codon:yes stop_codon:yes gene_type:complete